MSLAIVLSGAPIGLDAPNVTVEVRIGGLPARSYSVAKGAEPGTGFVRCANIGKTT